MKKLTIFLVTTLLIFSMAFVASAQTKYVGYSEANDHGYMEAEVIMEGEEILDVVLTEYRQTGKTKGSEYSYEEFHEAMAVLPEKFVEANSADVDTVSGATGTTNKAKQAVKMALDKAEGITQFDGKYLGVSEASERGSQGVAWVTVSNGEITDVKLAEYSEGEAKGDDYSYDKFHNAVDEMPERFVEANSHDVDIYSGATGSSGRWKQAVMRALVKAFSK